MCGWRKENGLRKRSVVNVSQIFTVDKKQLEEYIGKVSKRRMREILAGVRLLIDRVRSIETKQGEKSPTLR